MSLSAISNIIVSYVLVLNDWLFLLYIMFSCLVICVIRCQTLWILLSYMNIFVFLKYLFLGNGLIHQGLAFIFCRQDFSRISSRAHFPHYRGKSFLSTLLSALWIMTFSQAGWWVLSYSWFWALSPLILSGSFPAIG